ncbi:MAG TPA: hypothetical protein VF712_10730 [Thermoleophilaceae bacterium]
MELAARQEEPEAHGTSAGEGGGKELGHALDVLRARVDEEFRISERLDAKSRQAFALAAFFFAVVQTVAFGAFAQDDVRSLERVFLLAAAVFAGAALAKVAHRVTHGEDLQVESDLDPPAIVEWLRQNPDGVSEQLIVELSETAPDRTANNEIRGRNFDGVVDATRLALILAGVELFVAIAVRI